MAIGTIFFSCYQCKFNGDSRNPSHLNYTFDFDYFYSLYYLEQCYLIKHKNSRLINCRNFEIQLTIKNQQKISLVAIPDNHSTYIGVLMFRLQLLSNINHT